MSVLRQLQIEWNELVPLAQARGLRGVRTVRLYPEGLHERIPHRRNRLEWLRRELGITTSASPFSAAPSTSYADTQATPFVEPNNREFTFGAELEFVLPDGMTHADIARHISNAGIDCRSESYNHGVRTWWKVTTDVSINGGYSTGAEVVSPVLQGEEGLAALHIVCRVLTDKGCKVNRNCGFHVHVGVRNENLGFFKNLVRIYQQSESLIDGVVAPSRRGSDNRWAGMIRLNADRLQRATSLDDVARAIGQTPGREYARSAGRYCKLNLQSFWQHGTVEFRQHQGTVDSDKATNWVRFCLRLAQAARSNTVSQRMDSFEALLSILGASETETAYFMNRIAYFRAAERRVA